MRNQQRARRLAAIGAHNRLLERLCGDSAAARIRLVVAVRRGVNGHRLQILRDEAKRAGDRLLEARNRRGIQIRRDKAQRARLGGVLRRQNRRRPVNVRVRAGVRPIRRRVVRNNVRRGRFVVTRRRQNQRRRPVNPRVRSNNGFQLTPTEQVIIDADIARSQIQQLPADNVGLSQQELDEAINLQLIADGQQNDVGNVGLSHQELDEAMNLQMIADGQQDNVDNLGLSQEELEEAMNLQMIADEQYGNADVQDQPSSDVSGSDQSDQDSNQCSICMDAASTMQAHCNGQPVCSSCWDESLAVTGGLCPFCKQNPNVDSRPNPSTVERATVEVPAVRTAADRIAPTR